ncbi:MAG: sulfotransferase [Deltaproteobacteria bacterium]|nr:sulfotransferase [Deltaproteobacteria bacterium]
MARRLLGNSVTDSIIAEGGKIGLRRSCKLRWRFSRLDREFKHGVGWLERSLRAYQQQISPLAAPLVLISQLECSGGALLTQLLDGHPELHVHPGELQIGYPERDTWPKIDLDKTPLEWFEILFEDSVVDYFRDGFGKLESCQDSFLFIFLPPLQRDLFVKYLPTLDSITLRDVFDAYMTSYFGAWVNNQNMVGEKRFITALASELAHTDENMESYFEIYPEGRLISVIREPQDWYFSARDCCHDKFADLRQALSQWNKSAAAVLRNRQKYGQRVCLILFEDLLERTEVVMRYLAEFLGVCFDDILLTPTFNKNPLKETSNFGHGESKIRDIAPEDSGIIEEMTGEVYKKVLEQAAAISGA